MWSGLVPTYYYFKCDHAWSVHNVLRLQAPHMMILKYTWLSLTLTFFLNFTCVWHTFQELWFTILAFNFVLFEELILFYTLEVWRNLAAKIELLSNKTTISNVTTRVFAHCVMFASTPHDAWNVHDCYWHVHVLCEIVNLTWMTYCLRITVHYIDFLSCSVWRSNLALHVL